MAIQHYLYDETEETKTRFVSFLGENSRYDLAIIQSKRFFGKQLILNIQTGKFAIMGQDDLEEPGYLEDALGIREEEVDDLKEFIQSIIS